MTKLGCRKVFESRKKRQKELENVSTKINSRSCLAENVRFPYC